MAGQVLVAPDKFKGSLPASAVAAELAAGLVEARPGLEVVTVPVADGGDGTVDAAVAAGFDRVPVTATGPTGKPVAAAIAVRGEVAVVELAAASGLGLLTGRLDPLGATSRGTGDLLRAALDAGCTEILLGVGGSACTDGGAGLLQALGARLLDSTGAELAGGGGALAGVASLDLSGLDPRLAGVRVVLASDVDNPLTGAYGAAAVYGPQKGATGAQVRALDAALAQWAELVGSAAASSIGAGAAGGVGYSALAVLGAQYRSGIEVVLDLVGFAERLAGAVLVITGEGSLDEQTLRGKAPAGVAAAAQAASVPVVAVCGQSRLDPAALAGSGIRAVYPLTDLEPDLARCIAAPGPLLRRLARRIAADWLPPDR